MIDETATLNKIKQFVTEEYSHLSQKGAVIVKSVGNGYLVNGINVKSVDNFWQVTKGKSIIAKLRQRRVAILLAALASKGYYRDIQRATVIDKQLDIYLGDKQMYSIRYKANPDNQIYADRLVNVETELELLDQQLHELEKTVSLQ